MGWQELMQALPPETVRFDASECGLSEPIVLRRIADLSNLIRVAATQREARSLARHFSTVYGFPVTEEAVQVAAVVAACWQGPSLEELVRMSRHQGRLLLDLLKACNRLNGWHEDPFGEAGGGGCCSRQA